MTTEAAGEGTICLPLDVRAGADDVPATDAILRKLDGLAPTSRPALPTVDALAGLDMRLAYNVFNALLELVVRYDVHDEAAWPDADLEMKVEGELQDALRSFVWDAPKPLLTPLRLTPAAPVTQGFTPRALLLRPQEPTVGCARIIMGTDVSRDGGRTDPELLKRLDGCPPAQGESDEDLKELPGIDEMEWISRGYARLGYHEPSKQLIALFSFDVTRAPTKSDLDELAQAMNEALFTGWGMNLRWKLPRGVDAQVVVSKVIGRDFAPKAS